MHVPREPFLISERLVRLSDQIAFRDPRGAAEALLNRDTDGAN